MFIWLCVYMYKVLKLKLKSNSESKSKTLSILRWSHASFFLEEASEIRCFIKTAEQAYLLNGKLMTLREELASVLQSDQRNISYGGLIPDGFYSSSQLLRGDAKLRCDILYGDILAFHNLKNCRIYSMKKSTIIHILSCFGACICLWVQNYYLTAKII